MSSGKNYLVEIYDYDDKKIFNIKLMANTWERLTTDRIWFLVVHIDCPTDIGHLIGSLRTKAVFTCCQLRSGALLQSTHSSSSLHLTSKQYGLG